VYNKASYGKPNMPYDAKNDATQPENLVKLENLISAYLRAASHGVGRYAEDFVKLADDYVIDDFGVLPTGQSWTMDVILTNVRSQATPAGSRLARKVLSLGLRLKPEVFAREDFVSLLEYMERIVSYDSDDFLAIIEILRNRGHAGIVEYLWKLRREQGGREGRINAAAKRGPSFVKMTVSRFMSHFEEKVNRYANNEAGEDVKYVIDRMIETTKSMIDGPLVQVLLGFSRFMKQHGAAGVLLTALAESHLTLFIHAMEELSTRSLKSFGDDVTAEGVVNICDEVGTVMKFVEALKSYKEDGDGSQAVRLRDSPSCTRRKSHESSERSDGRHRLCCSHGSHRSARRFRCIRRSRSQGATTSLRSRGGRLPPILESNGLDGFRGWDGLSRYSRDDGRLRGTFGRNGRAVVQS
jgi:hypothetical protein